MVEIRTCTANDFEQVFLLLQQLWPEEALCRERLRDVYGRGITSDAQRYLCAVAESRIAGFCSMTFKNSIRAEGLLANIDEMVVHHANRGRGIGSQLLQAAIASATERGCARVELESAFRRVEAHAFYERRGFQNRAYYFSLPLV